ncbi:MAG: PD-(D/E)XK nuclease domain-containing protein, partial [Clostridia bacterium]|nr:PD-(D/E)XK nuclease domain-containing protein [Clostridia bacterium]
EIALEGTINKITEKLHLYLNNLSNRDFQRFDEKYVKLLFYSISMNLKIFSVKSEMEVNRKYPDLLIVPKDYSKNYKSVMIEFKYLKKDESNKLQEKQEEARKQILEYSEFEDIKAISNLSKYTVIAVDDEIYIEKI